MSQQVCIDKLLIMFHLLALTLSVIATLISLIVFSNSNLLDAQDTNKQLGSLIAYYICATGVYLIVCFIAHSICVKLDRPRMFAINLDGQVVLR